MTTSEDSTMRDQILATALGLFSSKGYAATTTREITNEVGITPAALYYHFENKDACLVALVEPYLADVEDLVARSGDALPTDHEVHVFLNSYNDLLLADPPLARFIDRDPAVATHPVIGPRIESLTEALRKLLAGPNPDGVDLVRASAALGALRRPALRLEEHSSWGADAAIAAAMAALGRRG